MHYPTPIDPTPLEILVRAAEVRSRWSPETTLARQRMTVHDAKQRLKGQTYSVPEVVVPDMGGREPRAY